MPNELEKSHRVPSSTDLVRTSKGAHRIGVPATTPIIPELLSRSLEAAKAEADRADREYTEKVAAYEAACARAQTEFHSALTEHRATESQKEAKHLQDQEEYREQYRAYEQLLKAYLEERIRLTKEVAERSSLLARDTVFDVLRYEIFTYLEDHKNELSEYLANFSNLKTYDEVLRQLMNAKISSQVDIKFSTAEEVRAFVKKYLIPSLKKALKEAFNPGQVTIVNQNSRPKVTIPDTEDPDLIWEFLSRDAKIEKYLGIDNSGDYLMTQSLNEIAVRLNAMFTRRFDEANRSAKFNKACASPLSDLYSQYVVKNRLSDTPVSTASVEGNRDVITALQGCFLHLSNMATPLPVPPPKPVPYERSPEPTLEMFLKMEKPQDTRSAVPKFPDFLRTPRVREQMNVHLIRLGIQDETDRVCAEIAEVLNLVVAFHEIRIYRDTALIHFIDRWKTRRYYQKEQEVSEEVEGLYQILKMINILIAQGQIYAEAGATPDQRYQGRLFLIEAGFLIRQAEIIAVEIEAKIDSKQRNLSLSDGSESMLKLFTQESGANSMLRALENMSTDVRVAAEIANITQGK